MNIRTMYKQSNRIFDHGIEGYEVKAKYLQEQKQSIKVKQTSLEKKKEKKTLKETYLDEYTKLYGNIPGPGAYLVEKKSKKTLKGGDKAKKMTYLDKIIAKAKKENGPAPGQYTERTAEKEIKKKESKEKKTTNDRISYLDAVQYIANEIPGVGNYNVQERVITALIEPMSAIRFKQNASETKIRTRSRNKTPDMGTYYPKTIEGKSFSRKKGWGTEERFKNVNNQKNIGPGYYECDESHLTKRKHSKSAYH